MTEYIGVTKVMKILNVKTRRTIYRWVSSNSFLQPYKNMSGTFLWDKAEVEVWKQEQLKKGIII